MASIISRIRIALPHLPRYAIAAAWFFAIASMIPLIWIALEGHGENGQSRVFGTNIDGVTHAVWGLTYNGTLGLMLLWLELLAVVAATVMAALPARVPMVADRMINKLRHIGHGYLTGWAGLWMLGTMYLAAIDPGFWTLQATFVTVLFACTVYRTISQWSGPTDGISHADVAADEQDSQLAPDPARGASTPFTDIEDVSRFMLHRSAVRPSQRVRELDAIVAPNRMFADSSRTWHSRLTRAQQFAARQWGLIKPFLQRSLKQVRAKLTSASQNAKSLQTDA